MEKYPRSLFFRQNVSCPRASETNLPKASTVHMSREKKRVVSKKKTLTVIPRLHSAVDPRGRGVRKFGNTDEGKKSTLGFPPRKQKPSSH